MNDLIAAYRNLIALYDDLIHECPRLFGAVEPDIGHSPVDTLLANRSVLLSSVENLNSEVAKLAGKWKDCRDRLDPQTNDMIRHLSDEAKSRAVSLREMCGAQAENVRVVCEGLREKLEELGSGSRLLKTLKPPQHNYPKFIDSRC